MIGDTPRPLSLRHRIVVLLPPRVHPTIHLGLRPYLERCREGLWKRTRTTHLLPPSRGTGLGASDRDRAIDAPIDWVTSEGLTQYGQAILLLGLLFPGSVTLMFYAVGLSNPVNPLLVGLRVLIFGASVMLSLVFLFVTSEPRGVRVGPNGVELRFIGRSRAVPWSLISLDLLSFDKYGLRVRYLLPRGTGIGSICFLTPKQGRALLNSRYAPRWVGPPDVLASWGVAPVGAIPVENPRDFCPRCRPGSGRLPRSRELSHAPRFKTPGVSESFRS